MRNAYGLREAIFGNQAVDGRPTEASDLHDRADAEKERNRSRGDGLSFKCRVVHGCAPRERQID